MEFNPSWTPDLPPAARLNEGDYYTGMFLANIAYGAAVTLALQCLALLRYTAVGSREARRVWTAIVLFILIIETICVATAHIFEKEAFITYRNFPGGPRTWIELYRCQISVLSRPRTIVAYLGAFFSIPRNAISFIFFMTSSLACDAVLVSNDETPIITC
jgi:hypothetical protein